MKRTLCLHKLLAVMLLFLISFHLYSCGNGGLKTVSTPSPIANQITAFSDSSEEELKLQAGNIAEPIDPLELGRELAVSTAGNPEFSLFLQDNRNNLIDNAPFRLEISITLTGDLSVGIVTTSDMEGLPSLLGYLRYASDKLHVEEVNWNEYVYSADEAILFSAIIPKHLALAVEPIGDVHLKPIEAGTRILEVIFSNSSENARKAVSLAPRGANNKVIPELNWIGGRLALNFEGRNMGDYNLDGAVSIADVSILAQRFHKRRTEPNWDARDNVVDGNGNGAIEIGDVKVIADNFFSRLSGYDIDFAFVPVDSPEPKAFERIVNTQDSSKPTVEFVIPPPTSGWPTFNFELPDRGFGTYYVKVIPVGKTLDDRGIESDVVSAERINIPPLPPSNFHFTSFTKNSVSLAWAVSSETDVVGYHIYFTDDPNADSLEELTKANSEIIPRFTTTFEVTNLTTNTTYYFFIASEDANGLLSEEARILATRISVEVLDLPPAPPANFRVSETTYTSVSLAWDESQESDVVGYNIYYTTVADAQLSQYQLANPSLIPVATIGFTLEPLTEFTTYYFVISAVDEGGHESLEPDILATRVQALTVVLPIAVAKILEKEQYGQIYEDYPLTFSAEDSYSPAGARLVEFTWDFGDGSPIETIPASGTAHHIYPAPSLGYNVTLTVKDEYGVESSTIIQTGTINQLTEQRILLVWNINSPNVDGVIKDYYGSPYTGRGIPAEFVLGLPLSMNEEISRSEYDNSIRMPIQDYLNNTIVQTPQGQRALRNVIHYIVTTKDVPLKISGANNAAVDSELTLLFETYDLANGIYNPFYGWESSDHFDKGNMAKSQRWQPFSFTAREPDWLPAFGWDGTDTATIDYLVTRLTAYTLEETLAMIDRSLNAYSGNEYYIILDDQFKDYDRMNDPPWPNIWPQDKSATTVLTNLGYHVYSDTTHQGDLITAAFLGDPSISNNVLGYCSHGVHSDFDGFYILEDLQFGYLPGALFMSYESFNGTTFKSPPTNPGRHGQVADWIRMGGTGGIGNVYEPYSFAVGDESIMFAEYLGGRNLAESAYKGIMAISWMEVVVGDPLTTVNIQ